MASDGARQGVNDLNTRIDDRRHWTVEEIKEVLSGPLEVVIEDAVAYWLEDDQGRRLSPDSDRTIKPFLRVLELHRSGTDPDRMLLWALLESGDRYEVSSGVILLDMAESAAGICDRLRRVAAPRVDDVGVRYGLLRSAPDHRDPQPRHVLHELRDREVGNGRGLAQRQAAVPIQGRGECATNSRLLQQGVVGKVNEHGLWPVAIEHHDRFSARITQSLRRVVLELADVVGLHRCSLVT